MEQQSLNILFSSTGVIAAALAFTLFTYKTTEKLFTRCFMTADHDAKQVSDGSEIKNAVGRR